MENNWNGQMMLDYCVHDYLISNGMHKSAEMFSKEANFKPETVALKLHEGLLSDWWSIFWSIYSTRYPEHAVQDDGSGPSNYNPAMPSYSNPAMPGPANNYMLQNMCPTMSPGFLDFLDPSIMQMQDYQNSLPDLPSSMMPGSMQEYQNSLSDLPSSMMSGPLNGNFFANDFSFNGTGYSQMVPMPVNGYNSQMVPMPDNGYNSQMAPMPENGNSLGTYNSLMVPMPENGNSLGMYSSQMVVPMPENGNFLGTYNPLMVQRPENRDFLGTYSSPMVNGNSLGTDFPQMVPMPENGNFRGTDLSRMRNGNLPGSDFPRTMPMPENVNLLRNDFTQIVPSPENGNSLATDLSRLRMPRPDQLACMPSTSNPSSQRDKVYKKNPQLCIRRDDTRSLSFQRFTDAGPSDPSPKPHELRLKSPERDSRSPAKNLNFNSLLSDPHLVPTSINFSHSPQEKLRRKPHQLSLKSDDKSGACFLPQAIPSRMELAASTDAARACEPPTQLLPSGSNLGGPKKNKKQRLIPAAPGVKKYGVGLKKSTTSAEPAQLAPRVLLPKVEPAGTDARAIGQRCIGLPPGMELDSNSQDDGRESNLKRSADAEPTPAPKAAKKN